MHWIARRANALVLLDKGMGCEAVADVLLLDDDTVRRWYKLFETGGIAALETLGHEDSDGLLSEAQEAELKAWVTRTLPCSSRRVGAFILARFGIEYQSRSGLIKLLHRIGMVHRRPCKIPRKLDPERQGVFIFSYINLLNGLAADEVVVFGDARAVACWAPNTKRP